jgi:molecular chaperone DnaK
MARDNRTLGRFVLQGLPAAPRGVPQIEVTFDIDANGILHVSAKDKASGKENKITIKANSGLNEDEIQRMVKDAEANKAEDHRRFELAQARNTAEASAHQIRKALAEHGAALDGSEKEKIEAAIKDVEEALKGDDKDAIEAKTQALMPASQKLGEKLNASMDDKAAAAGAASAGAASAAQQPGGESERAKESDVVDADYKEVKRG